MISCSSRAKSSSLWVSERRSFVGVRVGGGGGGAGAEDEGVPGAEEAIV